MISWQLKIACKLVLSRLPLGYDFWKRISLFRHGRMDRPEYAFRVVRSHYDRVHFARKSGGFVAMEIGPGDSLLSAVGLHALGAKLTYLIDVGPFARQDFGIYSKMIEYLEGSGFSLESIKATTDLTTLHNRINCKYLIEGLESFAAIPDASVDLIWSQAVLEHVRLSELDPLLREMRRVLRPDGVCSHRVDLKDHLGGALNNLRFSHKTWESNVFAKSGFYTNRVRFKGMMERFKKAGFDVECVKCDSFDEVPIVRSRLADDFRGLDEEDLKISGFDIVLKPA